MVDSTNNFFIDKGEKPVISISEHTYATKEADEDTGGANKFDARNAEIGIDLPDFHFSLSLPEDALRELVEKAVEFLGKKEEETRNGAESKEIPVHAE